MFITNFEAYHARTIKLNMHIIVRKSTVNQIFAPNNYETSEIKF